MFIGMTVSFTVVLVVSYNQEELKEVQCADKEPDFI